MKNDALEKVRKFILANPDKYDQSHFIQDTPNGVKMCITGIGAWMSLGVPWPTSEKEFVSEHNGFSATLMFERASGLSEKEIDSLSFMSGWPASFFHKRFAVEGISSPKLRARRLAENVSRRIQFFMKHGV